LLHDVDGILSYELLHEPWVGDHVGDPDLLLGLEIMWEIQICSSSEALLRGDPSGSITMRAFVRAVDPRTPVLYSPAQISPAQISPAQISPAQIFPAQTTTCHASSRIRKRADGVSCLLHRRHRLSRARDPAVKALCHVNDSAQLDVRRADLKRLGTGGFVTEFGGMADVDMGRAEVRHVASLLEGTFPLS
jgi:hypothetical protein